GVTVQPPQEPPPVAKPEAKEAPAVPEPPPMKKPEAKEAPAVPVDEFIATALSPQTRDLVKKTQLSPDQLRTVADLLVQDLNTVLEADLIPRNPSRFRESGEPEFATRPHLEVTKRAILFVPFSLGPRLRDKEPIIHPTGMMKVRLN